MIRNGFTLIDCLVSLLIIATLASLGTPHLTEIFEKRKADSISRFLLHSLLFARSSAVSLKENIIICGSENGSQCSLKWSHSIIIFSDKNKNKKPELDEIINQNPVNINNFTILTKVSFGLPYVKINSEGNSSQLGSFIVCPHEERPKSIRRITWNRAGRAYYGADTDKDGIINATDGGKLYCT
ncbi:MAG: GspH/FimT family pseudopilin [Cellvibrionaceae bacterium]